MRQDGLNHSSNSQLVRRAKSHDTDWKQQHGPKNLLEDYDVDRVICKTLQGSVVLMREKQSGKLFAVKIALKRLVDRGMAANGVRICENICNEAKILRSLAAMPSSQNIIQYHDQREDDERHILIMEFAGCGELFDWIKERGVIANDRAVVIFRGLTNALTIIHGRQICHLDLSLENILLMADQTPKICDFGLARSFQDGVKFRGDPTSRPGKLSYMSPEVYAGDGFYGPAADIWSLGIILFIIVFGFPPFEVASPSDVRYEFMARHGLAALLTEWGLRHRVSEQCLDLITSMLRPQCSRITLPNVLAHPWLRSTKK